MSKTILIVGAVVGGFLLLRSSSSGGGFSGPPRYNDDTDDTPAPKSTLDSFLAFGNKLFDSYVAGSKVPTGKGGVAPGGNTTKYDPDALIVPSWM